MRIQQRRRATTFHVLLMLVIVLLAHVSLLVVEANKSPFRLNRRLFPGRPYYTSSNDIDNDKDSCFLHGREFDLFDTSTTVRAGGHQQSSSDNHQSPFSRASTSARTSTTRSYDQRGGRQSHTATNKSSMFHSFTSSWWSRHNTFNLPRIQCRIEPTTTLKIRKTFFLLKTIITFQADYNTQLKIWQFQSSWEDVFIGGRLVFLNGRELQLTKSWQLSSSADSSSFITRLRLRATLDLSTLRAYARVGFRTAPVMNMAESGFRIQKQLPLDGTDGHVKLECKANVCLPEPEIEYSTENHRSLIGMGDLSVNVEELNLILDY